MPPAAVVTTTAITKVVDKPSVTMTMTVPSNTTTVPADTSKKSAFHLLSQLEHNLLIKQNVSSAAQEVITADLLTNPAESTAATVSRSKSPTPKQVMSQHVCCYQLKSCVFCSQFINQLQEHNRQWQHSNKQ